MQVVSQVFVFINNTAKNSPVLFFFFFNLAAVHCRFLTDKFPEGEVGREGAWFCFLNVCNIVGSITYNLWIQVVPFTKRRLTPFLTC